MLTHLIVGISLLPCAGKPDANTVFLKEYTHRETELVKVLSDPQIWKDPKRKYELIGYVKAARLFRSRALVKLLAPNIDFAPYERFGSIKPIEDQYPVMGTLAVMGMIAVPELLNVLKKNDPEDKEPYLRVKVIDKPGGNVEMEAEIVKPRGKGDGRGAERRRQAGFCLLLIYDRNGFGGEMLRKRIELEIKNTPVKERGFLK